MSRATDISWLAGLLEGEGCFRLTPSNGSSTDRLHVRVALKMTDKDVVERASSMFPGATKIFSERKEKPHHKQNYKTEWSGNNAITLIKSVRQHLGARRRLKTKEILECSNAAHSIFTKECSSCDVVLHRVGGSMGRAWHCSEKCKKAYYARYAREYRSRTGYQLAGGRVRTAA